ncbi:MAG TPA: hypothetical protein VFV34_07060, partial [Blastocatellia bacterium]|nr:hypothetical protein [Blastocatellia bacterium]
SLERNQAWVGKVIEVLIQGPAEEEGFVQGHSRGNHVVVARGDFEPGIHRLVVEHATPNRLYCCAPEQVSKVRSLPVRTL